MKLLVIDTALGACTVGVFEDDRPLAVRSEPMIKGHSERIGGFVRDVVADAGEALGGFEALDRIGVTVGPGSFTGLRVGLAFAQGLGAALDIPVVGISTLAALAQSKHPEPTGFMGVAATIDARRGQVYLQIFHDGMADEPAQALSVEAACALLVMPQDNFAWSLVGSGAPLIVDALPRHWPTPAEQAATPERMPSQEATGLIVNPAAEALAALTFVADPADHPPSPLYLRAPDATPPTRLPGQARPPRPQP